MSPTKVPVTIARGDGIGPEIMEATLLVLEEAGAQIAPEFIEIGESVYLAGNSTGIDEDAWESIRRTQVLLKGPITTPQGGGYKSLNVTIRKTLGLYANVRPCVAYHPFVETKHPGLDMVVVRENEEDLYGGIEHRQTPQVYQCLKLITRPGSEMIVRYAFEYARRNGRKKVTALTKDNIMKLTDGLFHKVFDEVAQEYPDLEHEHWIVDIGMARMADTPEIFDVVVMPNLYGDIASDIAAQLTGSVGLAGSANIGAACAMFEAIHGSAPPIAGQGVANPSGLLHGAIMMLVHIGQPDIASRIHNAWLKTMEDEVYTFDIADGGSSVGTMDFAKAVAERLGRKPSTLAPVAYAEATAQSTPTAADLTFQPAPVQELDGVDVFINDGEVSADDLGRRLSAVAGPEFELVMITNRGVKVYPGGFPETFCTDHWRCRFQPPEGAERATPASIRALLARIEEDDLQWIKLENLYRFDGELGYSLGQGQ